MVNPIYSDVVSLSDIPAVSLSDEETADLLKEENGESPEQISGFRLFSKGAGQQAFASPGKTYHSEIASAGTELKQQLKDRSAEITIYFESDSSLDWDSLCMGIYASAVAYTGVSTEGDYLRYEYAGSAVCWKAA